MKYMTFIDEAGNTGNNLLDLQQPLFVLGAMSLPHTKLAVAEKVRETLFLSVKEKEETEIKATKWHKSSKKCEAMAMLLYELKQLGAQYHVVVVEKRFMIAGWAVNTFFDYANVGSEDMSFVNDTDKRKFTADYYEQNCSDEDLTIIGQALQNPTREAYLSAIDALRRNAPEQSSIDILDCAENNVDDLLKEETAPNEMFAENVFHSPNLTAFAQLGSMIAIMCKDGQTETELIFDECPLCNHAFLKLHSIFSDVKNDFNIPGLGTIYTWKNRIMSVQKGKGQVQTLLQAADVLATSTDKVLQKCPMDDFLFKEYERATLLLLSVIYSEDHMRLVTSQKLMQNFKKSIRLASLSD